MKIRRWIASILATILAFAFGPVFVHAQGTTTGSTTGGTSSGVSAVTGGSTGGTANTTAQGVSASVGSGLVTSVATVAASGGTPSATTIPSNSNFLGSNYVNYFTLGLPQNYQTTFGAQNTAGMKGTFGKYVYVPNPTTTTTATTSTTTTVPGWTTFGQPRAPAYSTSFAETFPVIRPELSKIRDDVLYTIAESSMLKNKATIQAKMNGAIVQLNGVVGTETERRTAEGMVRMTPGVQGVQNNLQIDPSRK